MQLFNPLDHKANLWPSGLDNCILYKRFVVQTLLLSLEFVVHNKSWAKHSTLHFILKQIRKCFHKNLFYVKFQYVIRKGCEKMEGFINYILWFAISRLSAHIFNSTNLVCSTNTKDYILHCFLGNTAWNIIKFSKNSIELFSSDSVLNADYLMKK